MGSSTTDRQLCVYMFERETKIQIREERESEVRKREFLYVILLLKGSQWVALDCSQELGARSQRCSLGLQHGEQQLNDLG